MTVPQSVLIAGEQLENGAYGRNHLLDLDKQLMHTADKYLANFEKTFLRLIPLHTSTIILAEKAKY